jgi:hypothetical protein
MRAEDLWAWGVEDYPLKKGPLALQEYLQEMVRNSPGEVAKLVEPPAGADTLAWQFEHLRQFILELNLLVTHLRSACTREHCGKMKSLEGVALCSVHKVAQECSAMDYAHHNLDHATTLLFGDKMFSRSSEESHRKHLEMVMRRLLRIFSHAQYSHKEAFRAFEQDMHLLARFTQFCQRFDILPAKSFEYF